jgi:copper chaperone CopZ
MSASEIRDLGLTDKNAGCACCSTDAGGHAHASLSATSDATSTAEPSSSASVVADYLVEGMTCSHCVLSVTEELSAIAGVETVDVDLNAGGVSRVRVASSGPLGTDAVRAAVEEAGYALTTVS